MAPPFPGISRRVLKVFSREKNVLPSTCEKVHERDETKQKSVSILLFHTHYLKLSSPLQSNKKSKQCDRLQRYKTFYVRNLRMSVLS